MSAAIPQHFIPSQVWTEEAFESGQDLTQATLDEVSADKKARATHIKFHKEDGSRSINGEVSEVIIYGRKFAGEISLSQFPNIRSISFAKDIDITSLESIDISENAKLNRINLVEGSNNEHVFMNATCSWIIKERQLNQVLISYYKNRVKCKLLKQQSVIPYILVESGKRIEQLEAEIEKLNQQIENLKKEAEQTPTFSQFKELVNIAISPDTDLDFNNLKYEIKRLKMNDILPYTKKEKDNFKQLVADAKNKVGTSLDKFLDLFLQINKQVIEREQESDSFAQGQINAYQSILQEKLNSEELQTLLNEQRKVIKSEKQLIYLQTREDDDNKDDNNTQS